MSEVYSVYSITNIQNGKMYIGISIDPLRRWREHKQASRVGGYYINRVMRKYGIENFQFDVFDNTPQNHEQLKELEKYYIKKLDTYNNGYNCTKGGDGLIGYTFTKKHCENISKSLIGKKASEETRLKLSESHKGQKAWNKGKKFPELSGDKHHMYGKNHSEESKKKMSESLKGKIPWNKAKVGLQKAWNKGIQCSEETKKKISLKNKGKTGIQCKTSKITIQYNIKTGEEIACWFSTSEASRELSINNIRACCQNKVGYKSAGGYAWKYLD